ncbi:hypothetical protein GDO78_017111 [Eleutherodactylus coqui]|uniref:Uncharacterized protein n=1 Tax=Eleutherodactylus coqui TaxID=57060 RepID=A0A8J6E3J5_ELECQ|nr:hypothetical protein GDO78_017111 [Eleutherodactylus coqui]
MPDSHLNAPIKIWGPEPHPRDEILLYYSVAMGLLKAPRAAIADSLIVCLSDHSMVKLWYYFILQERRNDHEFKSPMGIKKIM